jgi:hypothetical protein
MFWEVERQTLAVFYRRTPYGHLTGVRPGAGERLPRPGRAPFSHEAADTQELAAGLLV